MTRRTFCASSIAYIGCKTVTQLNEKTRDNFHYKIGQFIEFFQKRLAQLVRPKASTAGNSARARPL
jgi:hypothetical protein